MQSVALLANWLDSTASANPQAKQVSWTNAASGNYAQSGTLIGGQVTTTNAMNTAYYPWYQGWPSWYCVHYEGPPKPIRLAHQEVERLRAAAKRDAKLKAVLAKFTDLIEVIVDFDGP